MRRVRYYEHGGPEVLRLEDAEVPDPSAGQVLLRAEAIGANYVDALFRRGAGGPFSRPLPGELTGDVVGTVEAVGDGVDPGLVGSRVAALADPAVAEYALAGADWLAPVPDGLGAAEASVLPMAAPVALRVLRTARLEPGETVLVHAGAGGIGHLAVQLAKLLGAGTVIATASSAAKLEFAAAHGADVVVDYTREDWPDRVRAAAPSGVDVVADSAGGEVSLRSVELLAPFGRSVLYGAAGGELAQVPFLALAALKQVAGFSLLAWRSARPRRARAEMTELAGHVRAGRLRTTLFGRYPLDEISEVHRLFDERAVLGRVLVTP
ncbi:quinone oxidoreductase family protein [Pseudonocardia acaciae]|uniref:quinone oxidoreductase family protein n=1 Tax=Pseudonocardia acaciae TaxID=551276 RepID=UPI00048EC7B8|nr:zinc-binding dehydrogenase [Pseudonocardia acaciae]